MDDFMFFGTKDEYKAYEKKHQPEQAKQTEERADHTKKEKGVSEDKKIISISASDTSTIDDETLRMLKRTRHRNDPQTVYMQSDVSFYDVYYTKDSSVIDDEELVKQARAINRIYKSYPKYLNALEIREAYMDKLIEKVGGYDLFVILLRSGSIQYWMPPVPIYSKRAEDYEDGSNGIIDTSVLFEWNDDWLEQHLENNLKELGITEDDIEVVGDVATDIMTIRHSDLVGLGVESDRSVSKSVNLSDLHELQKMFRGWYQEDSPVETNVDATLAERAFSMTPERIRHDYYMSKTLNMNKEFHNAINGIPNVEPYDPNEMVYDPVLNRPMARKEYNARELVRQLKESGWTESLKLMKLLGVGSSREYSVMKKKNSKKKRSMNKKRSGTYATVEDDIYGESTKDYEILSDLSSLKSKMFPD